MAPYTLGYPKESLKRAIVVFYNHRRRGTCTTGERSILLPVDSINTRDRCAPSGAHTRVAERAAAGSVLPPRLGRRERDLRATLPPPPARARAQLLGLAPGSPPIGWEQTREEPLNEVALAGRTAARPAGRPRARA